MNRKKYLAVLLLGIAALLINYFNFQQPAFVHASSSQPPTRYTNAPGESNCTSCHSSYSLTSNSSSIVVSSTPTDIFTAGYTPGTTYAITLTLPSGYSVYGFEMTCLKTGNTAAGTFARTNTTNTSLQTASSKQYIGQRSANSTRTWSFNWTAPAAGTGTVTFYGVGNLCNGNGSESGDRVHAKSFAVSEIIVPTCNMTATTSTTNPSCYGSNNGSATVTPSNGTSPYSYSWSNGANTATASNLAAGSYTVTVTDANACTATATANITQPTALTVSTSVVNVTAAGQCNGSATATPSGGTSPYTYSWSNGATTATASNLCAGSYTVTVTDAHGCTATSSATVTQPAGVSVSISSSTNVTCNGSCNGSATASASGGSTPYSYHWSNGATTATASNLCAGSYNITVTDANNSTASQSVTISQPTAVTASTTTSVATCGQANGSATVTASGGTSGYTYQWSNNATTATASNLAAGSYTVTVTDAHSCTATTAATVGSTGTLPGSAGTITGSTTICPGSATYSVTSQANVTYTWAVSGGGTVTPNGNTATINWTTNGTYTVSVTPSNSCGSSAPSTLSVTVGGANISAPTITGNTTPCPGNNTYTVAQQSGITYTWAISGGGTVTPNGNTATINWTTNGAHTISVTPASSCGNGTVGTLNVTVANNTPATPTVTGSTTPCTGVPTTYTVGAQSGVTFNWAVSGGGTVSPATGTSVTITWTAAGNHSINVTPTGNCGAGATGTLSINATQGVVPAGNIAGAASVCANSNVNYSISPGTSGGSYTWSVSGGGSVTGSGTSATVHWTSTGTYTLSVTPTATCGTGTPSTLSVIVTNLPTQPAINGPNDVCTNTDQLFTVNGSAGSTYTWSVGGNANYTATFDSATIHWPASGAFNISVTSTNACGSSPNGVKTINVKPTPSISLGADTTVCGNTTLAVNGTGIGQYLWSDNSTAATLPVSQSGNYSVTVTGTNSCTATDSKQVTVNNLPALTLFDSDGCDSVEVDAGPSFSTYNWSDGEHGETVNFTQSGTYTVTVADNGGCTTTGTVNVNVDHTPLADFSYTVNGYDVVFTDYSTNPGYYIWDFGDGQTDTLASPTHTYATDGAYHVILKVGNSCSQNSFYHTVYVGNATGLDNLVDNNAVQVYPNPATDKITVVLHGDNGYLEVMNTMGKVVYTGNIDTETPQTIDFTKMASALYLIKVTGKDRTYYGKVIKN